MAINNVWRNFIIKPRLTNNISDLTEIGYTHYGPSFAISGTLSALNKIILVDNISIEVVNLDKKTSHFMDWFAFRPKQHVMGKFSEINLTMASKFTITPEKTYDYNILFVDNNHFSQIKTLLQAIKDAWAEYLIICAKEKRSVRPETIFPDFKKLQLVNDAHERLKSFVYWSAGKYLIKLRLTTRNPKQFFNTERSFILLKSDEEILTANTSKIIENICQQPHAPYCCITPLFLPKK